MTDEWADARERALERMVEQAAQTARRLREALGPHISAEAAIEQRLSLGNSSSQRLAWGIYEDRTFRVAQWAGADPDTIGYRVRFADATVETGDGAGVALWDVRPDAMSVRGRCPRRSLLHQLGAMQTPDLAEIMRRAYGAHGQPPAPKPASLVAGVARLLGTSEATARDWLIAKVSAFRGESEATTAARLAGEEGTI